MDDAVAMRRVEGGGDFNGVLERLLDGNGALAGRSASVSPSRHGITRK